VTTRPNTKKALAVSLLVLTMPSVSTARTVYVDADAIGANNGSSWADACNYLQNALAHANSSEKPVQIRVAKGTYRPDQGRGNTPGDRQATFQLINGVMITGGYAGFGEPDPNTWDFRIYEAILSGDLNGDDGANFTNNDDNSFHVVTASGTDFTAVLDGFTISAGNAEPGPADNPMAESSERDTPPPPQPGRSIGAGMLNSNGSPTIKNCTFAANWALLDGGAVANFGGSPTLVNCTFNGNYGHHRGGGMHNYHGSPMLTNCIFTRNLAAYGGGMFNSGSSPILTCCIFRCNSAGYKYSGTAKGGAIYNSSSSPTLINCILDGNRARYGGGLYNRYLSSPTLLNCTFSANSAQYGNAVACHYYEEPYPSTVELANCILWDGGAEIWNNDGSTITVTYSNIQGEWPGEHNISTDPCFAAIGYWDPNGTPEDGNDDFWVDGDYHLKSQAGRWNGNGKSWVQDDATSPCIDAGDMSSPIANEPLANGGVINMGAYGGTAEASKTYFGGPACETIIAGDINGDCKLDYADFAITSFRWLESTPPVNSNSIIDAGIEYRVQTNKRVYELGENVEIWFTVTNRRNEPVKIACSQYPEFNLWVKGIHIVWSLAGIQPTKHSIDLAPGQSAGLCQTWDMKNSKGSLIAPGIYTVVGVMYNTPWNYDIHGRLYFTEVPVPITIAAGMCCSVSDHCQPNRRPPG